MGATIEQSQLDMFADLLDGPVNEVVEDVSLGSSDEVSIQNSNLNSEEEVVEEVVAKSEELSIEPVTSETNPQDEIIENLRNEIARLSGLISQPQQAQVFPKTESTEAAKVVTAEPAKVVPSSDFMKVLESGQYLSQEELDEVIDKPELINQAIHKGITNVIQGLQAELPSIVSAQVQARILVNNAVTEFYQANGDLAKYSDFVQSVLKQKEAEMGDKTYREIFEATAVESRKRLGLIAPNQSNSGKSVDGKVVKPAFAGSKGGNSGRPATGKSAFFDTNAADMLG